MERLKEAALEKIRCVYTEVRGMAQCIYPLFFLGRLLFSFFFFSYLQDSNQRPHFHHSHCKREISRILNSYFIGLFPSTRKSTKCSTGFWTLDGANIVIFFCSFRSYCTTYLLPVGTTIIQNSPIWYGSHRRNDP